MFESIETVCMTWYGSRPLVASAARASASDADSYRIGVPSSTVRMAATSAPPMALTPPTRTCARHAGHAPQR